MFRNDYAFSIAVHMLNGFAESNISITQLPIGKMIMSFDTDDICAVNGVNDITFLVERPKETGTFLLVKCKDTDVHIMNKYAIVRHFDRLMELYE